MTSTPDKQAVTAAYLGCAATAGYAVLKVAWALGSTLGVSDKAVFEEFLDRLGGPLVALWATVLLALLAGAILLSLVQPWGLRVPRRLRASLAWLGFATMTPVGLLCLGQTLAATLAGNPFPMLTPAIYIWVYGCFTVLGLTFAVTAWRTRNPEAASPPDIRSTVMINHTEGIELRPRHALRIGGWANAAIATAHVIGLIWAWSMFRAVGIEEDMRELAAQGAALPYILTLITAAAFFAFGLYGLSGAGDLRRLPFVHVGLVSIAAIYVFRATWGAGAIADGDGAQIVFAAIALLIGLCYAYGARAHRRPKTAAPTAVAS
jgi:hypothetical protein